MPTQLRELDVDLITRGHLERGVDALHTEFAGTFSGETIERYEDWEFDDPADADLDGVWRIRDGIAMRVGRLLDELVPGATSA